MRVVGRYFLETLGCPKNQVDSDKLEGYLAARGFEPAGAPEARRPGCGEHLRLHRRCTSGIDRGRPQCVGPPSQRGAPRGHGLHGRTLRRRAARCAARSRPRGRVRAGRRGHRRGDEPFRRPPCRSPSPPPGRCTPEPRSPTSTSSDCPALRPGLRGPTSRWRRGATASAGSAPSPPSEDASARASADDVLAEVDELAAGGPGAPPLREIVLVAQDLASYGRDRSVPGRRVAAGRSPVAALDARRGRARRPHAVALPLSLGPHRRADLRRPRDGRALLRPLPSARLAAPARQHAALGGRRALPAPHRRHPLRRAVATFRSSFILGYPGETERDHDLLLEFLAEAQLDWAGFFPFSARRGDPCRRPARPGPPRARARAAARMRRAPGHDHRRSA